MGGTGGAGMTGEGGAAGQGGMSTGGVGGTGGAGGQSGGNTDGGKTDAEGTSGEGGTGGCCTPAGDCTGCFVGSGSKIQGIAFKDTSFDGAYVIDAALGPPDGSDGHTTGPTGDCIVNDPLPGQPPTQTVWKEQHWQLKGPGIVAGQMYTVNLHVYGVVECKTYNGGTGPATTDAQTTPSITQSHNLWLTGATDNGDHWNTYAITVSPTLNSGIMGIGRTQATAPDAAHTWFMNECPSRRTEQHFTWRIDAPLTIQVPGESWINYVEYDSNCRFIVNCGAADASVAGACPAADAQANTVPVMSVVPAAPAALLTSQPPKNTAQPAARGQWWLIDVLSVQ
jgi:hypothetical protein